MLAARKQQNFDSGQSSIESRLPNVSAFTYSAVCPATIQRPSK
jgi:hypothetical protein